ncbi:MAG TPA: hypothetical protein VMF50_10695 [Candidatus Binataceae bacterium]|nr:hypothetical protein [Candidatus Binataceae bacterium]
MGDVVDIRPKTRKEPRGSRGEKAGRLLLPFCPQIKIGDRFTVILGKSIDGKRASGQIGQPVIELVIEHWPYSFEISRYIFSESEQDQLRTRKGDILLAITNEIQPIRNEGELLAAVLSAQNPASESDSAASNGNPRDRICVRGPIKKVDADLEGCLIGRNTLVLRPKNHSAWTDHLIQFFELASYYLPCAWEWLAQATSAASGSELVSLLRRVHIPIVPAEMAQELQDRNAAYQELSESEADGIELLECRNRNEFDRQLLQVRAEIYAVQQAREASSSGPYLIRNFYPFPIAFPYRSTAGLRDHTLLVEQFRVTEGVLAFVGSLALVLNSPASSELSKVFSDRRNFSDGAWLEIGRTAIKTLNSADHGDLAHGLKLLFGGIFPKRADRLVELRNNYHHNRIDSSKISDKTSEMSALLATCFDELAFIVRFPLIRICDGVKVDRSGRHIHEIEYYRGADPIHEAGFMKSERAHSSGLYVNTDAGLKDLFPFITIYECPNCSQPETYFLDRAGKNHGWSVKSFERGHSLEVQDVSDGLSKWCGHEQQP